PALRILSLYRSHSCLSDFRPDRPSAGSRLHTFTKLLRCPTVVEVSTALSIRLIRKCRNDCGRNSNSRGHVSSRRVGLCCCPAPYHLGGQPSPLRQRRPVSGRGQFSSDGSHSDNGSKALSCSFST